MIPLAKHIGNFLLKCFTQNDIQIEKPQYLDETLLPMPSLAIESLAKELDRYRDLLITSLRGFISYIKGESSVLPKVNKLDELSEAITQFITQLTKSSMSDEVAERLAESLSIRDQYAKSTEYLKRLMNVYRESKTYKEPIQKKMIQFLDMVDELLEYIDTPVGAKPKSLSNRKLETFDEMYKKFKSLLVKSAVTEVFSVRDMEDILMLARSLRGMIRSFSKAQKLVLPSE